ncbi:MAG: Gfo/Idh/MocA family oxidoreductase [Promethearchaeota archaeon]|nr:MAG: Gfo/Idh/MocA family oxidoreductase [Candidatus Lokiarchaeota archaeon]
MKNLEGSNIKKNTAVVGAGWFGSAHCRVFDSLSNLVAVCDTDINKAKSIAEKYGINYYKDHRKMIKNEKIDSVSIVIPPRFMPSIATDFIEADIDILLEKPMGTNLQEVEKLLPYEDNVRIMCGFIELFNPVIERLKNNLKKIGNPIMVSSRRIGRHPHRKWELGVLLDLGIHSIYVQSHLFGDPIKTKSMLSFSSNDKYEDAAFILLRYKNGVNGLIETNWLTPAKYRKLIIYGEEGSMEIDYITQEISFIKGEKLEEDTKVVEIRQPYTFSEPLMREINAFLYAKKNPMPLSEGLKSLKIALDAHKNS